MILRKFTLSDYEEIVDMYYDFIKEVYSTRKIGSKYFFYRKINEFISDKCDIVIAEKDGIISGFTVSKIDDMGGITEPVYDGMIAYIKPKFRKGRTAYMLYNNVSEYAKELGIPLVSNSRIENGVNKMIKKHFNVQEKYIMFERS